MKKKSERKNRKTTTEGLRKLNIVVALLYAIQGVAILSIADSTKGLVAITTNFLGLDKLSSSTEKVFVPATRHLFDVNIAYIVVGFLLVAAVAHLLFASRLRKTYETGLKENVNKSRWVEYSITESLVLVSIALIVGVYDLSSLILIIVLTIVMNMIGLIGELSAKISKQSSWLNYFIGVKAGLGPWIVLAIYLWGALMYGNGLPKFVYWVYGSMFILSSMYAYAMYMNLKKRLRWSNYLNNERFYILLGFVIKSALAWQIFAGLLRK